MRLNRMAKGEDINAIGISDTKMGGGGLFLQSSPWYGDKATEETYFSLGTFINSEVAERAEVPRLLFSRVRGYVITN